MQQETGRTINQRTRAIVGSIGFLFLAPGNVAGVIPWAISGAGMEAVLPGLEALRWPGFALPALGGILLLETFSHFAPEGLGTPAPIAPTRSLVVSGSYRFVRSMTVIAPVSAAGSPG